MADSEKKLRARIEELELKLETIKDETFTSAGSAFRGLDTKAVRWEFSAHKTNILPKFSFSLICKACGASLGPTITKTKTGKL